MIISLLFLNLIKYSQRNVNMSHCDYIFFPFPYISYDFCFISFVSLLLKWLVVYDVSLLCELYLLSLKILIFVSFKIKKKNLTSILIAVVCGQWLDSIRRDSLALLWCSSLPFGSIPGGQKMRPTRNRGP